MNNFLKNAVVKNVIGTIALVVAAAAIAVGFATRHSDSPAAASAVAPSASAAPSKLDQETADRLLAHHAEFDQCRHLGGTITFGADYQIVCVETESVIFRGVKLEHLGPLETLPEHERERYQKREKAYWSWIVGCEANVPRGHAVRGARRWEVMCISDAAKMLWARDVEDEGMP